MNIFVLDYDIDRCAQFHCDKHVVKMILESAQLLSSAHRINGQDVGYRLTHKNHPCALWVRESRDNYDWLYQLTLALNDEYGYRYGKSHKSVDVVTSLPEPTFLEYKGLTPFARAFGDYASECNKFADVVEAYRHYYKVAKADIVAWKNREKPYWFST